VIDVSEYQGRIDWQAVHDSGQVRAFIKLTESDDRNDPRSIYNLMHARSAGMTDIGFYHVAHLGNDPVDEAYHFLLAAQSHLQIGDLPPALDIEGLAGLTAAAVDAWASKWFQIVDPRVGTKCFLYANSSTLAALSVDAGRPVWGANYNAGFTPPPGWVIRQFSETGSCAGITGDVDMDSILVAVSQLPQVATAV
jgi:lysozyme